MIKSPTRTHIIALYYQNVRDPRTILHNSPLQQYVLVTIIIIFTESWLNNNIFNAKINLTNIFRVDRDGTFTGLTRGGSVLITIDSKITVEIDPSNPF